MTYAAHWARFWSLVGAVGVGLSFLVWRPLSVLTVFLAASLCAGVLLALLAPAPGPRSPLGVVRWSRIASRAALVGAAVVALGAVSDVLPALAVPMLLVVLASSPACVGRVRRWRGPVASPHDQARPASSLVLDGPVPDEPPAAPAPAPAPAPGPAPAAPAPPAWPGPAACRLDVSGAAAQEMTDQELCLEWRRSFVTLHSARSSRDLARVVSQRQIYLDEMERRSPTGLRAWLESGARAAGGPDRFLTQRRRHDDQTDAA